MQTCRSQLKSYAVEQILEGVHAQLISRPRADKQPGYSDMKNRDC